MEQNEAFEELFNAYHRRLLGFAITLTGQPQLAEELVQDVFVSVWNKREKLDFNSGLKSYLFQSVRNASYDYLKKSKPHIDPLENGVEIFSDENPETKLLYNETQKKLWQGISQLPLRCREIFVLSRMEQFSNKQIAETLDISVKTVENQMTKALKLMRKTFFS